MMLFAKRRQVSDDDDGRNAYATPAPRPCSSPPMGPGLPDFLKPSERPVLLDFTQKRPLRSTPDYTGYHSSRHHRTPY
jgi:hypothetical protein